MSRKPAEAERLDYEEFILLAIKKLKKPGYEGIHTVYSGFNAAFREYFPASDPVKVTNALAEEGKVDVRPARGGAIIYPPGKMGASPADSRKTLKKMGL